MNNEYDKIPLDKDSDRIRDLKRTMRRRVVISLIFITINILSAVYVSQRAPLLGVINILAAVVCLPGLLMPLLGLYVIARSDGIYMDAPEPLEPAAIEEMIKDRASRFMFTVSGLYGADCRLAQLIHDGGIEIIESHLDRLRGEMILTFAALNDAKGARNILRFNNYICTDVREL